MNQRGAFLIRIKRPQTGNAEGVSIPPKHVTHGAFGPRRAVARGLAVLSLVLVSLFAHPGPLIAAEKVVLQLRWDHQFQFAGYYAALWQGYYAAEGLDVEIRSAVKPDGKILGSVQEVASGNADFGIGAADILLARDRGVPLVIAGTVLQSSDVGFVSKLESSISSPADMVGKRISRVPTGLVDAELKTMLWAEGIRMTDLAAYGARLELGSPFQQLMDGWIDIRGTYVSSFLWQARRRGVKISILKPSTYGVVFTAIPCSPRSPSPRAGAP